VSATPEHPTKRQLREFIRAEDGPRETERVREHLLSGCLSCLRFLRRYVAELREWPGRDLAAVLEGSREGNLTERIRRIERRSERQVVLVDAERQAAPALFGELMLLSPDDRRTAVRSEERYQLYGLAEVLTRASREACFSDLAQAAEFGELAREVADTLHRGGYPPGLVVDGLALAWAALGNAHRARTELTEAEWALWTARELLAQGSQDRSVRAEILSLEGSLRTDQAQFDEAVAVLEEAAALYRADGSEEREGKVLVQLGNAAGERGDVERAVALLEQARQKLGRDLPGELPLIAAQALVDWLVGTGKTAAARRVLDEIREESRGRELSFFLRQRVEWVAARLVWSEGDLERAERELRAVRERYRESEQAYRYCLVSLDLAGLLLEQSGRTAEVRGLAHEMLPVFQTRRIHNHALAALVLFQRAAEAETVTVALIRDLGRYLRHAQNNPYLAYPSAV
jgi:tetratricopeptide (TPR) repeat protein